MDPIIKELVKVSIAGKRKATVETVNQLFQSVDELPNSVVSVNYIDDFSTIIEAVSMFYRIFIRPSVRVRSLKIVRHRTNQRKINYRLSMVLYRRFTS